MPDPPQTIRIPSQDGHPLNALLVSPRGQTPPGVRHRSEKALHRAGMGSGWGQTPGVVVLHGFGSRKENHLDFAQRLAAAGTWAIVPDLRGHGETGGDMDEGMVGDVLACLDHLEGLGAGPLGIRGSSMGGFLALACAPLHPGVRAVVAICPARPEPLARRLGHDWPVAHPLEHAAWRGDGVARGFWHARGDEVVPWQSTFALHARTPQPKHLRVTMGGHHRSLQHDPRVQADTAAFLADHLSRTPSRDG
jgi:dienelactone hydrolase